MTSRQDSPFARQLRQYRRAAELTQEQLAERAGVSARSISDFERDLGHRPRADTLELLAAALGLDSEQAAGLRAAACTVRSTAPSGEDEGSEGGTTASAGSVAVRTFLIADVRGYTRFTVEYGDEMAAKLAVKFAGITRAAVADRGGEVVELRGDEALAGFASARNALRAAMDLQDRCQRETEAEPALPLPIGIGLDAGEAVSVADGYRGAALNLAARLCSLAGSGEVLVSETVTHLARKVDGLSYADRGMTQLKGFADPIKVVQVRPTVPDESLSPALLLGPRDMVDVPIRAGTGGDPQLPFGGFLGSLPTNPIVAREGELETLLRAVDLAAAGQGRTMLLAGEPGVGKTRLAQEATLLLRDRGFLIAAGRCYEAESSIPYFPFLDGLSSVFRLAPPAIQREVARRWPYLGALLPDEMSMPEVTGGSPDEQQRVFRAVAGFVDAVAAARPLALLVDDLHWADSGSLKLLLHFARSTRGSAILLLATYRDVEVGRQGPLEEALRDLSREGVMERIAVRRLDIEETGALMATTLGEGQITPEFAGLVYGRTEGNPFFVQQVMRVLVERGDVFRRDSRWTRKGVDEIEVPESVRAVIGQRLGHLAVKTQEVLAEASVLGQTFTFDELLAMADRPEVELEAALDETERGGLVRVLDRDTYGFDHALTQGTLYGELTTRRRWRLHAAAAQAIEGVPERRRQGREAELAWHLLEADEPARALPYTLLAGDAASGVYAHPEAERQYRTALELAREIESRLLVAALEKLGSC